MNYLSRIGSALKNNDWGGVEASDVFQFDEEGVHQLAGFSLWHLPSYSCPKCNNPKESSQRYCDTCSEYYRLLKQERDTRSRLYWEAVAVRKQERDTRSRLYWEAVAESRQLRLERVYVKLERRAYFDFSRQFNTLLYSLSHRPQSFYVGENNPGSKLTEAAVLEIRNTWAPIPGRSSYALARKFGISPSQVMNVANGDAWRQVGGPIRYPLRDGPLLQQLIDQNQK